MERRQPSRARRRPRLHPQVEHGLDARHARLLGRPTPGHREWHHDQLTFGLTYAWAEHFVLPLSHDEVVHLKRPLLGKMPGRGRRALRQPAGALRVDVGPPRQAAAVHGRRAGRDARVVARPRASTGRCSTTRATPACAELVARPQRARRPAHPALHAGDGDPAGFAWLDVDDAEQQPARLRAAPTRAATAWSCAWPTSRPAAPRRLPRRAPPRRSLGRRAVDRRRRASAGTAAGRTT